jgi:hypothetical protein
MAVNSQQYGMINEDISRHGVYAAQDSSLDKKLERIINKLETVIVGNHNAQTSAQVCELCTASDHHTNQCPSAQNEQIEDVNVTHNFYDNNPNLTNQYGNSYNPSWKNNPNLSYGTRLQQQSAQTGPTQMLNKSHQQSPNQPSPMPNQNSSQPNLRAQVQNLEEMLSTLTATTFQQQ